MTEAGQRPRNQARRRILAGFIVFFFLLFVYGVREPLTPFAAALIFAYILNPLVEKLEGWGWKRSIAILFLFAFLSGGIALILIYGLPKIFVELLRLGEDLPQQGARLQRLILNWQERINANLPEALRQVMLDIINRVESQLLKWVGDMAQGVLTVLSHLFDIVLIPVMTFYFLRDWREFGQLLLGIVPSAYRHEVRYLADSLDKVLMGFLQGHLLVATLVGAMTALGMALIGLEYALLIGLIAGLADLIPYFGPLIGVLPAVGLGLLESPRLALYAFLVMVVVQQIESNLISPKILGDRVGLHPLAILLALAVGGHFYGVIGLLLAVPVTAVLRVLIRYIYLKVLNADR